MSLRADRKIRTRSRFIGSVGVPVAALLFASAIAGAAPRAHAAPSASINASLTTIGSVDIQKVLDGYTKKAQSEADFQKIVDQYDGIFNVQKQNYMLSESDQTELGTLLLKANPTPADQDEIKTLEAKAQSDATELANLQQKTAPTDADKVRLAALSQEQQASQQILQSVMDDYKQQLDAKNQVASNLIANDVRAAVATVAQQKGLTVVFDSSLAIYATNDVTQLVIAKLNAGAK